MKKELVGGIIFTAACWLVALLSAVGSRGPAEKPLCAQDAVPLKPEYQVEVRFSGGEVRRFCNAGCALAYLNETRRNRRDVEAVTVTDETTGAPLDSGAAFYVESEVFTHRESSNRIHVFAAREDARRHASEFNGAIIPNPFADLPRAALPLAAAPETAGIALDAGVLKVDCLPSPEGLSFSFYSRSGGEPLDVSGLQARVIVTIAGEEKSREVPLLPPPGNPPRNLLAGSLDLREGKTFSSVLLFRYRDEPYVLRFPAALPYPPFTLNELSHDALPHGHVTPHDGFVEVFGDNHAELSIDDSVLRVFWYDVSMHQIPTAGLAASCYLEPCAAGPQRIELVPAGEPGAPDYLERRIPESCAAAVQVTLRIQRGDASRTFRYRLQRPVTEIAGAGSAKIGEAAVDGTYLLELRRPLPAGTFPGMTELELRFMDAKTLAPAELRQAPEVWYTPSGSRGMRLPAPRRLAVPGRWRIEGYLGPGAGDSLRFRFADLDGRRFEAGFRPGGAPWVRGIHLAWFSVVLVPGMLFAAWLFIRPGGSPDRRTVDLVSLLGLKPVLTSRLYPAVIQWPLFFLFVFALYRLFAGPKDALSNPAASLLLGVLLPAVLISPVIFARGWCAVCPFTVVIDVIRDIAGGTGRNPGAFLSRRRTAVASVQVAAAGLFLIVPQAPALARLIGIGLLLYAGLAAAMAVLYERRGFCHAVCPVGQVLGLFSAAAPYRIASDRPCLKGCPREAITAPLQRPFAALPENNLSVAVLAFSFLSLLSAHPLWLRPGARLGAAAAAVIFLLAVAVLSRARTTGHLMPLALASVLAPAFAGLSAEIPSLPRTLKALFSGQPFQAASSSPLRPEVLLSIQAGILTTGALVSALAVLRRTRNASPAGAMLDLFFVLAIFAALFSMAATSFHLRVPLGLLFPQPAPL
jgi:hypothetical protein